MFFKLTFLCLLLAYPVFSSLSNQKSYDYTFLGVSSNSSNEDLIKWELRIELIERGVFGISGRLTINIEITDEYYVEAKLYRSPLGNNNFQLLPIRVPKQTLSHFMATSYADLAMESFANCSNLPQSKNGQPPYLEKKVYIADHCKISLDAMPSYIPSGFVKLLYLGTGPVTYTVEIMIEIEPKEKV